LFDKPVAGDRVVAAMDSPTGSACWVCGGCGSWCDIGGFDSGRPTVGVADEPECVSWEPCDFVAEDWQPDRASRVAMEIVGVELAWRSFTTREGARMEEFSCLN
jgi:hypothetical protein